MESTLEHHFANTLVMLAELTIAPGQMDAFLDYTVPNLSVSRSYPGNLRFDMLIDDTHPGRVFFYEEWESAEAQQAYMAWRTQAGDLTELLSLLTEPPRFTALRAVSA